MARAKATSRKSKTKSHAKSTKKTAAKQAMDRLKKQKDSPTKKLILIEGEEVIKTTPPVESDEDGKDEPKDPKNSTTSNACAISASPSPLRESSNIGNTKKKNAVASRPTRSRRAATRNTVSYVDSEEDDEKEELPPKSKPGNNKKRKIVKEDEEEEEDDYEENLPPKRGKDAGKKKKKTKAASQKATKSKRKKADSSFASPPRSMCIKKLYSPPSSILDVTKAMWQPNDEDWRVTGALDY
jgi:hypothetical protein